MGGVQPKPPPPQNPPKKNSQLNCITEAWTPLRTLDRSHLEEKMIDEYVDLAVVLAAMTDGPIIAGSPSLLVTPLGIRRNT